MMCVWSVLCALALLEGAEAHYLSTFMQGITERQAEFAKQLPRSETSETPQKAKQLMRREKKRNAKNVQEIPSEKQVMPASLIGLAAEMQQATTRTKVVSSEVAGQAETAEAKPSFREIQEMADTASRQHQTAKGDLATDYHNAKTSNTKSIAMDGNAEIFHEMADAASRRQLIAGGDAASRQQHSAVGDVATKHDNAKTSNTWSFAMDGNAEIYHELAGTATRQKYIANGDVRSEISNQGHIKAQVPEAKEPYASHL